VSFSHLDALEALEVENSSHFRHGLAAIPVDADRGIAHFDLATVDLANAIRPR